MKKLLFTAIILFSSCTKQELPEIILSASCGDDTKTYISQTDRTKIHWSKNDAVWVDGIKFSLIDGADTQKGTFKGYGTLNYPAIGVYPFNQDISRTDTKYGVIVNIPFHQFGVKNSFDPNSNVIVSMISDDNKAKFHNVLCYIKVSVSSVYHTLILSGNNGEKICGPMEINCNDCTVRTTKDSEQQLVMSLDDSGVETINTYIIALAPTIFENGLSFVLIGKQTPNAYPSSDKRLTIDKAGTVYDFGFLK